MYFAIYHSYHSVSKTFKNYVVSHHDHCNALFNVQVYQDFHHDICRASVEITCRFIKQQDFRLVSN